MDDEQEDRYDAALITETLVSVITRSRIQLEDLTDVVVAVKTGRCSRRFTQEPHDIVKELRVLQSVSHPSIIHVIGSDYDSPSSELRFWMPYMPYSLATLLACPSFSPQPQTGPTASIPAEQHPMPITFMAATKSIMFQVLSAVEYLHDEPRRIAHRDIKPHNILLDDDAVVKLIDFGIAYKDSEDPQEKVYDVWLEDEKAMYFEVGSGPYRAPELMFGPRSYNAMAADMWSIGTTFAEFFTTLHRRSSDDDPDNEEDGDRDPTQAYITKPLIGSMERVEWERYSLFDSTRGDIGLAWSIFKTRGSPTEDNWPTFRELPDASKVNFVEAPGVELATLLPHLPMHERVPLVDPPSHFPPEEPVASPLDLVLRFLVYPPASRLPAKDALRHPWFEADLPLLLPASTIDAGRPSEAHAPMPRRALATWLSGIAPN